MTLAHPKPEKRIKAPKPLRRSAAPKRTKRPRKRRATPIARLKHRLDTLFSKYVKDRDGLAACITCGKPVEPTNCNAGHFIRRGVASLRWDPRNVHVQHAVPCNHFLRGSPAEYALAIMNRYGEAELRRLMARKALKKHWTRDELVKLIAAIERGGADFECAYYESNL